MDDLTLVLNCQKTKSDGAAAWAFSRAGRHSRLAKLNSPQEKEMVAVTVTT